MFAHFFFFFFFLPHARFFLLHFYLCVVPQRYCRGTFSEKRVPTIGTDFLSKRIEIRGEVNFVLVI
jgi:hypothetical protein